MMTNAVRRSDVTEERASRTGCVLVLCLLLLVDMSMMKQEKAFFLSSLVRFLVLFVAMLVVDMSYGKVTD